MSGSAPTPEELRSLKPQPKITAAALGGAIATVALWLLQETTGIEPAVGVEAATATIATVAAGYIKRPSQEGS